MRTVSVKLMADAADFSRKMRGAGADVKSLSGELDRANKAGRLDELTSAATGFGIGLVGVAGIAAKFAMDFEKQMSHVKAATHASAGEMEQLRQAALKAGADTQFSATQAAQGVEELAKAGIATTDILSGGLKGALDLAAAGTMEVADAAEITASALTQFKLKGSDVPHVADLLSAAAGKAQGSVADMGAALNQSGLIAAQTGLTIEDTTGTLASFASAGLLGSDAGTSFKTMLQMLQAPSGKTKELMEKLGISAYDASGSFIGITALAGQLKTQLSTLTPELRANAMAQIFGSDATRAASILYEQGAAGIQGWIDKTNDAGYAAETAAIKTDNLAGDLERLKGSLETLAIEAGGGANGGLRVLTQGLNAMVDQFAALPPVVGSSITVLGGVTGAALLLGVGWMKARAATADMLTELRQVGPNGERAAVGIEKTRKAALLAGGAFIGLQAAGMALEAFGPAAANVDRLTESLNDFAASGRIGGEAARVFGHNLDGLADMAALADRATGGFGRLAAGVEGVIPPIKSLNEWINGTSFSGATAEFAALDQSFTTFLSSTNDLTAGMRLWNTTMDKSRLGNVDLAKQLPGTAAELGRLQAAAHGDAKALTSVTNAAQLTTESVKEMTDAFESAFDRFMDADRAAIKYADTLESTNKELKSGTRTLQLNTKEGRENRGSVLDLIDAIDTQRTSNLANGDSLDVVDRKYGRQMESLRKTLKQMGFNRTEINKLIGKYEDIPKTVNTKVSTTGVSGVQSQLSRLSVYQQALKKGVIPKGFQGPIVGPDGKYYAEGGWTGPGAKYDAAGVVHADEFVIRKESRRKIEQENPGLLDRMNQTGRVAGYAAGGYVAWPFPVTAAKTRVPSRSEVASAVGPPAGRTSDWIVATVRARFPGIDVLSKDRPGSRTLSGNVSYHSLGRAVDFEPSRALAQWWDANYRGRTKELISPYQQYNIHNGRRHRYTGTVWNQHNFAGGNAHNHIAMGNGGVINEHVVGVGASGTTYEFGERGRPETVVPGYLPSGQGGGGSGTTTVIHLTAQLAPGANAREAGRLIAEQLQTYLVGGGSINVRGAQVLP